MLKYIKKRLFKYFKNNNINNNNTNKKTKHANLFSFLNTKKEKKKMSENFLKAIKDAGLSHGDVLKILKKEGKIKDPQTYAEIYKVEEAKRLEKEKAEKEKAEKEKDKKPPAEEPATPPTEPAPPTLPTPTPPKTATDPLTKRFDEFEAKMTKLIKEGERIPLATPSAGIESEKKKEGDFSLALDGKYEKYV